MLEKRLKCEYEGCQKSYCSSFNLKRHIELTHLGVKKFECNFCSRFLSSKQNLIDHINIHTGSKPYVCEVLSCGQAFRQLSQYYIHRQLHSAAVQEPDTNYISDDFLRVLALRLNSEPERIIEKSDNHRQEVNDLPKIGKEQEWIKLPGLCKIEEEKICLGKEH